MDHMGQDPMDHAWAHATVKDPGQLNVDTAIPATRGVDVCLPYVVELRTLHGAVCSQCSLKAGCNPWLLQLMSPVDANSSYHASKA
jgi:hypothetical protein